MHIKRYLATLGRKDRPQRSWLFTITALKTVDGNSEFPSHGEKSTKISAVTM